jgi:hypothetical protein
MEISTMQVHVTREDRAGFEYDAVLIPVHEQNRQALLDDIADAINEHVRKPIYEKWSLGDDSVSTALHQINAVIDRLRNGNPK